MSDTEDIFKNYYGKNYEKVTPVEIRKMKENFGRKYPNATMSKFDFEVTVAKDGTVSERNIFYKVDLTSYDITSDTFRDNPERTNPYTGRMGGERSKGALSSHDLTRT
jgi:hypothetical protein